MVYNRLSVYKLERKELVAGDRVRITRNDAGLDASQLPAAVARATQKHGALDLVRSTSGHAHQLTQRQVNQEHSI